MFFFFCNFLWKCDLKQDAFKVQKQMSADIYEDETKRAQNKQSRWFMGGIAHKLSFFNIRRQLIRGAT